MNLDETLADTVQQAVREALDREPEPKLTLTATDIAHHLGCSVTTARELMNSGELQTLAVGKRRRVMRTEFLRWLEDRSAITGAS